MWTERGEISDEMNEKRFNLRGNCDELSRVPSDFLNHTSCKASKLTILNLKISIASV